MSPILKHDGRSVEDDGRRDPLVCCHMHLLSLTEPVQTTQEGLSQLFFFFFIREDYPGG